ncbi:NAD(P)/FAD-dependent oxidoreductase [Micromonospora sp. 4G57]|uniref:Pyridine nucleotide-disulfide oxidoreductase domain-containing protein 2 n=1 Tax=Micromonospora sicca TaxID=2202420 RepID=A0ABU5JDK6_9ACTN|nr:MULTISPECIES: NAD(P)/FAD-dependent oxidoreductase [unclassified Micromonospora]MDZ5442570.1 NAD(P)/FAD-dependent oxidoreductase [Micromonospora sp. 4G57]MDZ5490678.1 NAD(P)/FAD-dependent oxidoreductase [Micromonospora sp. 4G53]
MSEASELPARADVVIVGSGHNGLVSAILLARAGLDVLVLEAAEVIGGATRTENPFPKVPELRHSTGSYLLGLMPPELLAALDVRIPVLRRDPHYFLPTPGGLGSPYLLFGSDTAATRRQLAEFFSTADVAADDALQAELAALREDLAPAWLTEPLPVEETAERYVRPALRQAFVDLVRGSVADYLARFDFRSELLVSMYAVTDGLSGLNAGPDDPGTGHNFLVHNMCRLPGAGGTWMIAEGGMGTVSRTFAEAARTAGATIRTGTPVTAITLDGGAASGVVLADGRTVGASVVLGACDPYRLMDLLPDGALPAPLGERMAAVRRPGTTLKLNLALTGLPRFSCLPADAPSPFGSTIHLLPGSASLVGAGGESPMAALRAMWADVQAGRLPEEPTIEWYLHTTVDPSLSDPAGHHSSALFVQSVPYELAGTTWDEALPGYVSRLIEICERYAPGAGDLIADAVPLPPPGIEAHFGITGGHIHHVDNTVSFTDRMPYATGVDGVYAGSAGCHPAGSVIGAAGHNAARRILTDLGR